MNWVTEHHPDRAGLAACVQCGLCLPVCPTFRLTGRETASPRGRLQAMVAVADGHATVDGKFEEILDFCLGCRACEPVCPGMVPYGSLLEGARAEIVEQRPSAQRRFRGWALGYIVPSRSALRVASWGIRLLRALRLTPILPQNFTRSVSGVRPLGSRFVPPSPGSGADGGIGLLVGCIQQEWFPDVNTAAIELMTRAGIDVAIPEGQTCCGALAAHDGHADVAERLGVRNERAFQGCDVVVATAAGCSAHLRDRLGDGAADVTSIIADAIEAGQLPRLEPTGESVVVQDPCHLRHAQRSILPQRVILEAAGYALDELDDDGMCCGAAGLYTVLQPDASARLGAEKAERIRRFESRTVASANPGCEMQLRAFLGAGYRIAHPIELYREALERLDVNANVAAVERR